MPSSVIKRYEYTVTASSLRIWYLSGAIYDYQDVPPKVFNEFKNALSKGSYLNRCIKGRYGFKKVMA
ncbi:MAG: KTSC domain-containing protein [Chitinophagaceae bacterium]